MLHFFCLENQIVLLSESLNGGKKKKYQKKMALQSLQWVRGILKYLTFIKWETAVVSCSPWSKGNS